MANASSAVGLSDAAIHTQYNNLRLDAIGPYNAERVWNDNQHARFGTLGADGDIYSDGIDLFIDHPGGGNINLQVAGTTRLQITSTGFNLAGDQLFGDNEKVIFGDGSDTSVYWDGLKFVISPALPLTSGGTGATTAAAARTNLGVDAAGTDNSTNVTLAGTPDYLTIAGQVITRGLIDLTTDVTGDLPVAEGGTGASTAAAARTNLGVAIGVDVQAYDADLAAFALKTAPTGDVVGTSDTQTLTNKTLTTPTLTLKQGLTPAPTAEGDIQWDTDDNEIVIGDGIGQKIFSDDTKLAQVANNLSDLASASTARTNLGLGSLATLSTVNDGNWSGTDLAVANGGTGASTAATARTNLGLAIGVNVQAYDADLDSWAGKTAPAGDAVGTSDTQTLTNKTLTTPTLTLKQGLTPAPTAEGDIQWDTDDNEIVIGDGIGQKIFSDDTKLLQVANNLSDLNNAATARTNLGVDAAGTDNSTDVTLAGTLDYLTIAGQVITRNAIDLTTDVTGDLPVADGGTGASTAAAARTNLGVDAAGTDNSTNVTLAGTPDYITIVGQVITRNAIDLTTDVTGDLPVAEGGTGASTAATARTNLGLAIGVNVQAYDADLDAWAGKTAPSGVAVGTTDTQTLTNKTLTTPTLTLKQGLTPAPTAEGDIQWDTNDDEIVIGDGVGQKVFSDDTKLLQVANNLSDLASAATARTNLGVDAAGTDNSTNVTLAGTPDYITIAGQVITRGLIDLTTDVTGDLPVAEGGTGSSTAAGARTNLGLAIGTNVQAYDADLAAIAALASTDGNFIVGSATGWVAESAATARASLGVDAAGTDNSTNVTLAGTPDYITIVGQVITRNAIDLTTDVTGDLPVAEGGTGSSTAAGARTNLGVAIGSDVQAYDAGLASIAGLTTAADRMIYTTLSDTYAVATLTAAGRALLDDASASAQRTTLGLAIGTDVQAYDADLAAIAALAKTDGNFIVGNGTAWVAETGATARTSLGLGSLATLSSINDSNWSGTDLSVANGGTGASSFTDHGVLVGSGTGAISVTGTGTAGQVLTSNGAAADPTFQSAGAAAAIVTGTYTGDGATSQAITGLGIAPKWVWIVKQSSGTGSATTLMTSDTMVDDDASGTNINIRTDAQYYNDGIISLDSDGFTVDDRGFDNDPNQNTTVYNYTAIG